MIFALMKNKGDLRTVWGESASVNGGIIKNVKDDYCEHSYGNACLLGFDCKHMVRKSDMYGGNCVLSTITVRNERERKKERGRAQFVRGGTSGTR